MTGSVGVGCDVGGVIIVDLDRGVRGGQGKHLDFNTLFRVSCFQSVRRRSVTRELHAGVGDIRGKHTV